MDINSISISGRLGQDPELVHVGSGGTAKTSLRLASKRFYTKDGEKVEVTTWVNVECWNKQAEVVAEHCTKGQDITVTGRLQIDKWEDKEGNKRESTIISADTIKFGARPGEGRGSGGDSSVSKKAIKTKLLESIKTLVIDNEIPLETALQVIADKED